MIDTSSIEQEFSKICHAVLKCNPVINALFKSLTDTFNILRVLLPLVARADHGRNVLLSPLLTQHLFIPLASTKPVVVPHDDLHNGPAYRRDQVFGGYYPTVTSQSQVDCRTQNSWISTA